MMKTMMHVNDIKVEKKDKNDIKNEKQKDLDLGKKEEENNKANEKKKKFLKIMKIQINQKLYNHILASKLLL